MVRPTRTRPGHIGEVIKSEAEHVNRLLADLLYLGEIDAGQVITRREDLPLEDLVERSLRHIEPQAAARDVSLSVDVAPEATLAQRRSGQARARIHQRPRERRQVLAGRRRRRR